MSAPRACLDCPAAKGGVFAELLPAPPRPCALRVATLGARDTIPGAWPARYALALVRRGILVRQRVDRSGRASAVDVVGPGSALFFGAPDSELSGYAAGDAMLCLCPAHALEDDERGGALPIARDVIRAQAMAIERMDRFAEARSKDTVDEQVAALLCALSDGISAPRRLDVVPCDLQQRDMAALLGIRHESVCRALGRLERAGAVARTASGIALLDRDALQAHA